MTADVAPPPTLAAVDAGRGFWVFAYGSLMWRPGFPFAERRRARLDGWRRAFRLWSVHYRGTPERPGLVLGLDAEPGAACEGVAYRVAPEDGVATLDYLRARELISYAYAERIERVALNDGAEAEALAYVVDPRHPQYAGRLDPETQAAVIARAAGPAGTNRAYLAATLEHLEEIGLEDTELSELWRRVAAQAD